MATGGMLDALYVHALATDNPYPSGVLVGASVYPTPALAAVIPTDESLAGHAAWAQIHGAMDAHYRGLDIIGFFAGRPGGEGALTADDEALLERRFARDGQLVIIFDTASHTGCVYARTAGTPVLLGGGRVAPRPEAQVQARAPSSWWRIGVAAWAGVAAAVVALAFVAMSLTGGDDSTPRPRPIEAPAISEPGAPNGGAEVAIAERRALARADQEWRAMVRQNRRRARRLRRQRARLIQGLRASAPPAVAGAGPGKGAKAPPVAATPAPPPARDGGAATPPGSGARPAQPERPARPAPDSGGATRPRPGPDGAEAPAPNPRRSSASSP